MIRKVPFVLAFFAVLSSAAFGLYERKSYTDYTHRSDLLNLIQVAELSEEIAKENAAVMIEDLPNSGIIVRVTATGEYIPRFQAGQQSAIVQKVYQGDKVSVGQEIYITTTRWNYIFKASSVDTNEDKRVIAQMGFVNRMEAGKDYLVFLDHKMETLDNDDSTFQLADEYLIAPIFSYDTHENVTIEIPEGQPTYVDYSDVKNNEFFACTKKALEYMLGIKYEMLTLYPLS